MGRIADALKRADTERRLASRLLADETETVPTAMIAESSGLAIPIAGLEGSMNWTSVQAAASSTETKEPPPALVEGLCDSLVPFFEPSSPVTEQYRSLRTRLVSQNPQYEHRVLAITSAVPKEGKSVTTLNLGRILAEIRHLRVLVVDGDFRRASLAHMLGQSDGPGLADVLAGEASYQDVVRDTPIANLKMIPAGRPKKRSAAELLTEASARPIFKRMQSDFHYTVVDTPPATTVTDVGIIGQLCDGVIMVVRLHRTHSGAGKRAVRLLQVNNIPILGCLIVGRDTPADRYAYGYGYRYNCDRYYTSIQRKGGET